MSDPIHIATATAHVLREMRVDAGMTVAEVSHQADIPPATISAWERDERHPNLEAVHALCKVYRVPLAWFVEIVQRRAA